MTPASAARAFGRARSGEAEQRLEEHPAVAEVVVHGVDHPTLVQEVKAVVVLHPGADVSADELTAFCAETLAYYKVPTIVEFRDEPLPRNAVSERWPCNAFCQQLPCTAFSVQLRSNAFSERLP